MPIEYIGIGFVLAVLGLVVQTMVKQTKHLLVSKKKDPIKLLRIELGAIKTEISTLETELQAISTKMKTELEGISTQITELTGLVSISPITSGVAQAATWSRGNSESQPAQGYSIVPTIDQSTAGDTWTRDAGKSDSVANTKGAIAEGAISEVHQASYRKEMAPNCTRCGKPMLLKHLHPDRFSHYKGHFECETCGRSVREVVTFASG